VSHAVDLLRADIDLLRAEQAGLPLGISNPDPPLHCFPLRVDWEMATGWTPSADPYPAALVTSYDLTDQPAPDPVAGLVKTLTPFGWTAELTYAHGCMPHATHGRPGEPQESWAVRLVRGGQRAVAVRLGGSWSSLWTWSTTEFFARHGTLEAFTLATAGMMVNMPARKEWDAMLVKYPTKAEWLKAKREQEKS
jgi:hypothetical protein